MEGLVHCSDDTVLVGRDTGVEAGAVDVYDAPHFFVGATLVEFDSVSGVAATLKFDRVCTGAHFFVVDDDAWGCDTGAGDTEGLLLHCRLVARNVEAVTGCCTGAGAGAVVAADEGVYWDVGLVHCLVAAGGAAAAGGGAATLGCCDLRRVPPREVGTDAADACDGLPAAVRSVGILPPDPAKSALLPICAPPPLGTPLLLADMAAAPPPVVGARVVIGDERSLVVVFLSVFLLLRSERRPVAIPPPGLAILRSGWSLHPAWASSPVSLAFAGGICPPAGRGGGGGGADILFALRGVPSF